MKFTDLNFQPHSNYPDTGIAALHFFPNGYGVSVVQFPGSYGFEQGLYELAVLKKYVQNRIEVYGAHLCWRWKICYDTPITDDYGRKY